ncbi:dihydrodipicolinate synthase family protein [Thalassotalea mangrovi]|uniref:Dihydrodipicolinate synthase family protein n=1 Tax=Thalassotalea mangrovi TaxID=2572245 RepID=A0A4U1B1N2_9GAMM|nr:dihydrodipicolinate synthase family protein [Thalassotalea mangrovi]TKB43063.1 dihydrodipicolinate synthase family protein [Thalassotalea mangrovi]
MEQPNSLLQGTFPVVPTPFHANLDIDYDGFKNVIRYIIDCDVEGLVFPGLASEYAQLSKAERLEATAIVGDMCRGKLDFVVGASAPTPEEAIEYSIAGAQAGAVCAMVMAPLKFAQDEQAMIDFYRTLAEKAQIPIMLQNAPPPMGAGLNVDTVLKIIAAVPQIHYVKEETMPCGQRIEQLLSNPPAHLKGVFGGAGGRYILDELDRNALGTVPACELTEMHKTLVDAHRNHDYDTAFDAYTKMIPILNMQAVYRCNLTKQILVQRGIINSNAVRVPGPVLDDKNIAELNKLWRLVQDYMPAIA